MTLLLELAAGAETQGSAGHYGSGVARDLMRERPDAVIMIVETASLAGCQTLWSEDLSDGATIRGVTIRNPFASVSRPPRSTAPSVAPTRQDKKCRFAPMGAP